jgi:hypothetical protein
MVMMMMMMTMMMVMIVFGVLPSSVTLETF